MNTDSPRHRATHRAWLLVALVGGCTARGAGSSVDPGSGTPHATAMRVMYALDTGNAELLRKCFDPESAAARRTAQIAALGMDVARHTTALSTALQARFADPSASFDPADPDLFLRQLRRDLRTARVVEEQGVHELRIGSRRVATLVQRQGTWFLSATAPFGGDEQRAAAAEQLLQLWRTHLQSAAELATQAADRQAFDRGLADLRKRTAAGADPLLRVLITQGDNSLAPK
ncbi:MAG: hypothetical protein KDC87_03600 [Planctomycetes bacterium]|nr:hypothetical protein [Planctomycetota bacterium]MCB9870770.1 hypothetical protein [Planctomycetota bacterium]